MGRRSSGGGGRSSSPMRSAPPARAAPPPRHAAPPPRPMPPAPAAHGAPPPMQAAAAPPPAVSGGGGMMSGLMGSVVQGAAMGTGMSMANRAVDAVMGPRQTEVVHRNDGAASPPEAGPAKCSDESSWVKQCFDNGGTAESCQYYADLLKQCKAN